MWFVCCLRRWEFQAPPKARGETGSCGTEYFIPNVRFTMWRKRKSLMGGVETDELAVELAGPERSLRVGETIPIFLFLLPAVKEKRVKTSRQLHNCCFGTSGSATGCLLVHRGSGSLVLCSRAPSEP